MTRCFYTEYTDLIYVVHNIAEDPLSYFPSGLGWIVVC